jgi:hypothetical protein
MSSYSSGHDYLDVAEASVDVRKSFPVETWQRLKGIRSAADPSGRWLADHPVPRFYEGGVPAQ